MKQKKLSVVISAFNEEQKIAACLESVAFAEEIILVNSSSTDKTVDIAKKYTDKVFTKPNNLMLNVNKNFGFSKASGEWILCLDADERVTPELAEEIRSIVNGQLSVVGYWVPRKNIIFRKWIKSDMWWPDYQLRLFKNGKGKFPEKHVHEYLEVDGETEKLQSPMLHENYSSISQFLYKMDKIYTESEVNNLLVSGKKVTWVDAIRFPTSDFVKTFFLQKGYKDGLHGLVLSLLQAFYAEVVFVKLWEKQGFPEHNSPNFLYDFHKEWLRARKEFQYWYLTSLVRDTKSFGKKILYRILRKKISRDINNTK